MTDENNNIYFQVSGPYIRRVQSEISTPWRARGPQRAKKIHEIKRNSIGYNSG